jgi:hypothetical protein
VREATASRTKQSTTKRWGPVPALLYCGRSMVCLTCQKDEREVTLVKCPICFQHVCVECGRKEYGRVFCSQRCAYLFFFGEEED